MPQGKLPPDCHDRLRQIARCVLEVATWGCDALPLGRAERRATEGVAALMQDTVLRYSPVEAGQRQRQGRDWRRPAVGWERAGADLAASLSAALERQRQQQQQQDAGAGVGVGTAEGPRAGLGGAEEGDGATARLQARLERARALAAGPACCYVGCVSLLEPSESDLRCRRCSSCRVARYCSPECQRADWAQHHGSVCAHLASGTAGADAPAAAAL